MKQIILLGFLLSFTILAHADGYWFEIKGSKQIHQPVTIKVCYGGVTDSGSRYYKPADQLNKLSTFLVVVIDKNGLKTTVPIQQKTTGWEGVFTPEMDGNYQILAINDALPVVERPASAAAPNIRPIQYLCTNYTVGKTTGNASPNQLLDIVANKNGSTINVQCFLNKLPVPKDTKLRIFNPENWEKLPVTDEMGKATFATTMKGLYIIRFDWIDKKPGTYKGIAYENIRHRCDYSLLVE